MELSTMDIDPTYMQDEDGPEQEAVDLEITDLQLSNTPAPSTSALTNGLSSATEPFAYTDAPMSSQRIVQGHPSEGAH